MVSAGISEVKGSYRTRDCRIDSLVVVNTSVHSMRSRSYVCTYTHTLIPFHVLTQLSLRRYTIYLGSDEGDKPIGLFSSLVKSVLRGVWVIILTIISASSFLVTQVLLNICFMHSSTRGAQIRY
jgi:hypothetical protein